MSKYNTIDDRMKEAYEHRYRYYLTENLPVIIRLDGCHFHSFCKGMQKPFDKIFVETMQDTMKYLCENIMGCKFGFVQSDEISLLLTNNDTKETQPWFGNNLQKIVSVSAALCTMAFNNFFSKNVNRYWVDSFFEKQNEENAKYFEKMKSKIGTAYFDARAFIVPENEVDNCFIWRQNDCTRNSVQSLAQFLYSQKEIHGINTSQLQNKMFEEKGINWNDLTTVEKRGTCCYRKQVKVAGQNGEMVTRNKWFLDTEMPILSQTPQFVLEKMKNV